MAPFIAAGCKSSDWSYEQEWRLVEFGPDSPFEQVNTKAVYVGSRADNDTKSTIKAIADSRGCEAFSMDLAESSYRMIPVPLAG